MVRGAQNPGMRAHSLLLLGLLLTLSSPAMTQSVTRYVRYAEGRGWSYGILRGDQIQELRGDLFSNPQPTGRRVRLADVRLLVPLEPGKVIAVGLNYQSHLGERPAAEYPGLFTKFPTSLIAHDADIELTADAGNAH